MSDMTDEIVVKYISKLPTYGPLKRPVRVTIEHLPDGYYADNADLTLYEYGETREEAIEHFMVAMEEDIHLFQDTADNELSPDLIDLKNSYGKHVTWQKQA